MTSVAGMTFAEVVRRVGAVALALPDVVEEDAWVGTRWRIRTKTFAHVVPIEDGRPDAYATAAGTAGPGRRADVPRVR